MDLPEDLQKIQDSRQGVYGPWRANMAGTSMQIDGLLENYAAAAIERLIDSGATKGPPLPNWFAPLRMVAVKLLASHLASQRQFLTRFFREAQAAIKLQHDNIVRGLAVGEDSGYYYFAMEFVDGETLHRLMLREGLIEEEKALRIARDVARIAASTRERRQIDDPDGGLIGRHGGSR